MPWPTAPRRDLDRRDLDEEPWPIRRLLRVGTTVVVANVARLQQWIELAPAFATLRPHDGSFDDRRHGCHLHPPMASRFLVDQHADPRLAPNVVDPDGSLTA